MNNEFPESFHYLSQEGHLISSCLSIGLTNLRAANVHEKGRFYTGLFNLSIGLERLLKSIIIIEHMANNNLACPSKKQMKSYGHNIEDLYNSCHTISQAHDPILPLNKLTDLQQEMLSSLSDFAMGTRYFNLDSLSSGKNGVDPIEHWGDILMRIWQSDVTKRTQEKILSEAGMVTELVQDKTLTIMSGMNKEPLTTFDALALPGVHNQSARYACLHIINVIYPLRGLVSDVSRQAYSFGKPVFPQMHDFLEWLWDDRKHVLGKKRWP